MIEAKQKVMLINNFVRWSIIISAFIISLTLLVAWILWITIYQIVINDALLFFGNKTIAQGYGINFDFLALSIISWAVIISVLLFAVPLLFYRKKTGLMVFIGLFNFLLGSIIIVCALLFIMTSYPFFGDFYQVFGWQKTLVVFLPWVIVTIADLFLIFNSLWILISSANSVNFVPKQIKEKNNEQNLVENNINSEQNIIHPNDQIIIPKKPSNVIVTNHNNKVYDNSLENSAKNVHDIKSHPLTASHHEKKTTNINSSLGPFTVYHENNNGKYEIVDDINATPQKAQKTHVTSVNKKPTEPKAHHASKVKVTNSHNTKTHHENKKLNTAAQPHPHRSKEQIEKVWHKAQVIAGVNPQLYRKDYAGAWMFREAYTDDLQEVNVRSYAWTIVNHRPLSYNGDNSIDNLDPMNVTNALTKGQDYPKWKTKISSAGNENIIKEQVWKART